MKILRITEKVWQILSFDEWHLILRETLVGTRKKGCWGCCVLTERVRVWLAYFFLISLSWHLWSGRPLVGSILRGSCLFHISGKFCPTVKSWWKVVFLWEWNWGHCGKMGCEAIQSLQNQNDGCNYILGPKSNMLSLVSVWCLLVILLEKFP